MKPQTLPPREWLATTAGHPAQAAAPQGPRQTATGRPRVAPREELVNTLEFETEAARVLPADVFRSVEGSDRAPFDRITFRPRLMVNCVNLDLSMELAGASLFAPIIVAPMGDQRLLHADAERATVRGASLAKAAVVVSARSSIPVETLAQVGATLFYQVFASDDAARNAARAQAAAGAGCKAVFVTVGATDGNGRGSGRVEWAAVDALRRAVSSPVVVKGIMTADDARTAVKNGVQALVVSSYGQASGPGRPAPLDVLPTIVDAVDGRVPVLVDGGFRRGTDIMKALALGARAVLVGRPVMWGLAAHGAEGVQTVLELLQTELGRVMGCCGTPNLAAITRAHVKVHAAASPGRTDV
jgi:isopentenyl diphosphate isomerase/L-lactate dehydrogenase-like FMN-dependent dehydrogenase